MVEKQESSRAAWGDRDKLAFLFMLIDTQGPGVINWNKVPLPAGRTLIACKRMVEKLRFQIKDDIEKLKSGANTPEEVDGENAEAGAKTPKPKTSRKKKNANTEIADGEEVETPKTPKTKTPRQKKAAAEEEDGTGATKSLKSSEKRGRKPKTSDEDPGEEDARSPTKKIKTEPKGDEITI